MATSGIPVRSFNLRSRDRLRRPQAKVTLKKINSANPKTPEKHSDLRSHDIVAKAGSFQRQLRPRKVIEKNISEGAHKKSSKTLSKQLQRHPKERKSTIKLKKTDETKKKLPVYKNINTEKSLEDQDSIYDFTFDPNDTLEKIAKKKQKKRNITKRNVKTTKNIKKDKKKPNIQAPEKETASNMIIAEQTVKLNINKKKKTTQIIKKDTKELKTGSHAVEDKALPVREQKGKNVKKNDKKDLKEQIDTAEKKTLHVLSLAEQKDVKESNKENSKKQVDIHTAEKKTSHVPLLAEQKKDVKENNKENSKEQVEIHTAEKKTLHVPLLVEQKEDLNLNAVKRENNIDRKLSLVIRTSEENFSPDATLTEQNETVNKNTPTIISIENADNITVNRVSNTSVGNFRSPLRPRNVFDNTTVKQQRKDNSSFNLLLTESLSPISSTANVNIDSPWRPPIFPMFSQAKYFTQSTPKVSSKISTKPLEMQDKENKQAIKKKMKKNKPAVDSKTLVRQENEENKLFVDDKEDRQVMDCEAVGKNERRVKDKEENEISAKQEDKHLMEYLNFSDTFDVLSDTEKRSTFGTEIRLFEDIEPTHFLEPPKRLYKRKRVKFNFLEENEDKEKEDKENEEQQQTKKKRKHTKTETKDEKRINEWVEAVNNTFKEIDSYDLLIE